MNYTKDPPEGRFDAVMITANSGTYNEACRAAERVDAKLKVVGGPHSNTLPADCVAEDSPFNVACLGEGEKTVVELVYRFRERADIRDLAEIDGLAVKLNGEVKVNPPRKFLDINSIPWPAYDLWPELGSELSFVASEGAPAGPGCSLMTSRGCPFNCGFCNKELWTRLTRFRDVDDVLAECEYLRSKFGTTHLRIQDDMVNLRKDRFEKLCRGWKELGMYWRAHTRTDHVSLDEFKLMKESGCVEVGLGVESGSQKILDAMNKQNTVENHANAIRWSNEAELNARPYLIIGFPGETWETVEETLDLIRETRPHNVTLSTFIPYPGCDVWCDPEKYNARITSTDWEKYWLIGLEETQEGFIVEYPGMTSEELVEARSYMLTEIEKVCGSRDRRTEVECET
jgi:radical SAM superfamily enzyme YgiQ (UPF0313 family)